MTRRWRRFGWSAMALALAACGSGSRPSATAGAAMEPPPAVSVTIPPPRPRSGKPAPSALASRIQALVAGFNGIAGVGVRGVDEGWTIEARGRRRLPQQSVSKLWVAMTLMDLRDQGKARLDDEITVQPQDLTLFHQPIAYLVRGGGYRTTVADLFTRAMTQSDNTANDRLLNYVGGPAAVRAFIERAQLGDIRFGPGERLLQSGTAGLTWQQSYSLGNAFAVARAKLDPAVRAAALDRYIADPPDGAAPMAIADALARLARGELLSETSTRVLLDTMAASRTGHARIRAALPPGWTVAHKTGTGQDLGSRNAGFNDVGIMTAPDGRRYAIAVMIGDTRAPIRARQLLIQDVARAVAEHAATARRGGGVAG